MADNSKKLILITTVSLLATYGFFAFALQADIGVGLDVISTTTPSVCNNNGTCEPGLGEDSSNCPLDCPITRPGGGGVVIFDTDPPVIFKLLVSDITEGSASVSWETSELAFCHFYWGKTQEYEKEVATENVFNIRHDISLKGLSPGTKYHFKISCQDNSKNESETSDQELITLLPADTFPPSNPSDFRAESGQSQILLSWDNPADPDFKLLKIVRSTDFYPSDPTSGVPVYSGDGQSFLDTGLTDGTRYYYTAFTYDLAGNYSSGAIVSGVPNKPGTDIPPEIIQPASSTPETEKLTIEDFDFFQQGEKVALIGGKLSFKPGIPLTAAISYEKVPEILKTIMVTLKKGEEKFSFLLRINKEKTRYEATIAAPEPGTYPLIMSILNYKNQSLKTINGELFIPGERSAPIPNPWHKDPLLLMLLVALMAIIVLMFFIRKKRKKAQEPQKSLSLTTWTGN